MANKAAVRDLATTYFGRVRDFNEDVMSQLVPDPTNPLPRYAQHLARKAQLALTAVEVALEQIAGEE